MIYLISILYLLISILSASSSNPLVLCLLLVMMSIKVGFMMSLCFSKWAMLSIILIFLGGMMVMFIYATAITNSEKLFMKTIPMEMVLMIILLNINHILWHPLSFNFSELFFNYSTMGSLMMVFLLCVLIFTLILSVKLVESFKGALKFFL